MSSSTGILVFLLKLFFQPFRLLKPRNKIVMITRQSDSPTLDFILLRDAIIKKNPSEKVVILAKTLGKSSSEKFSYILHMFTQMYHLATSHIIIVDGYCMAVCILPHKKNQKVIQTWHAVNVIKKFGYLALDMPYGRKSDYAIPMRMHRNYDYITSCGIETGKILAKSFDCDESKVKLMGLPRIDYIRTKNEKVYNAILRDYPQVAEKPCILYAPTFRKGRPVKLNSLLKAVDLDKYNLIVKLHPVDMAGFTDGIDSRIICDTKYLSYDWLWHCQKIITDYSGIGIESALLSKELYFYFYDYEDYCRKNGLILDMKKEPVSKYVAYNSRQLEKMLSKEYDPSAVQKFLERYIDIPLDDCSGQFADWVLELQDWLHNMK